MAGIDNLTPLLPGQVLNPHGRPKGSKNLSHWIRELLTDENFETNLLDSRKGVIEYKGAPIKALITVAIHRAIHDEKNGYKWAEWLGKYGYGIAMKIEGDGTPINVVHIYKPEKVIVDHLEAEAQQLRLRADNAVEAEYGDMESPTGSTNLRAPNT